MRNQSAGRRLRRLALLAGRHSFSRFAFFGLLGLAVDLTLLWLLATYTPLPGPVAVTLAFFATYAANFVLNRRFAFDGAQEPVLPQLRRFAPQLALDWVLVIAAVEILVALGMPLMPARLIAAVTNAVVNYTAYRWWTFAPLPSPHGGKPAHDGGPGAPPPGRRVRAH